MKKFINKKVAKINLLTGEILKIYDSVDLAVKELNCNCSSDEISKVCEGLRNHCCGYKWKYID